MTEPIRVLHFADTHIGMENYGKTDPQTGLSSRVRDFLRRMDEMVDYARAQDVDLVIFAGDAFKTRQPNPTYQREFAHRIRDLSQLAPVVLLVGNHDLPPTTLKASSVEIYHTLQVPNVWVADSYELPEALRVIETRRGPAAVAAAPYPIRSRLLADERVAGLTIAETDALLQQAMTDFIEELAGAADALDMPRLLTGHFTVDGAVTGSERQIMLGRDVMLMRSSLADPRWDYVALGHVHKHQNLTAGQPGLPPVVYSGSIERVDFGEEGDPKGFCWVELARGATRWQFVSVQARPFVTLRADLRDSPEPTAELIDLVNEYDLKEAVTRLILTLTPESEARLNESAVREALRQAGTFQVAGIRREVQEAARARLGDNPEGLTPAELLERYLISKEVPAERRAELLAAAQPIFEGRTGE